MPSEVLQKENKVDADVKEIVDKTNSKIENNESNSEEKKTDNVVQENDKLEKLNGSEKTKEDEMQVDDISEKLNSSEETKKVDGKAQIDDKSEKLNDAEELSESENKENKEPIFDEDNEVLKKRAEELLIDGKRHLIIKDFQAAVDVLSEACSIFGSVYGEMAEECAEAYFKYGCALLELSKDQINPVGLEENVDEDVSIQDESVTEVTKFETTDKVEEKLIENNDKEIFDNKEKLDKIEDKSIEKDEASVNEENKDEDENEELDEENIDEGDVNDLQLAWEMLDLAKVIYKNKDTEESKLKLAEVLMKCGEVSFEDEKFDTAIEDMTESLQIRR